MSQRPAPAPEALPRSVRLKQRLGRLLEPPRQAVRRVASRSGLLSDLYYALVHRAFSREHRAVLHGIYRYQRLEATGRANRFLLRRNTHRLEKGLLMRPRRPVFGLRYLEETVDAYARFREAYDARGGDIDELRWAHDVLDAYFDASAPHPLVDGLRDRFRALGPVAPRLGPGRAGSGVASVPYRRALGEAPPVDYERFYALCQRRRSVRWFADRPVPRELVDKAIRAALEAPSACNRQPFVFRVFDDPARVAEVATLPMGTKGFAHNFPAIVVLVGQLRAYFDPRDRHLIYIDGALAAMGFMLAHETLGLSSCPINWPDIAAREKRMAKALGLEPDQRAVMLIAVGYPDPEGAVAFSHKQSLDELRTWNA